MEQISIKQALKRPRFFIFRRKQSRGSRSRFPNSFIISPNTSFSPQLFQRSPQFSHLSPKDQKISAKCPNCFIFPPESFILNPRYFILPPNYFSTSPIFFILIAVSYCSNLLISSRILNLEYLNLRKQNNYCGYLYSFSS